MDNLQTSIISKYQTNFPKETLNKTSQKTGIQITRVFRLFNGSEMKVSEYEAFERALSSSTTKQNDFMNLSKKCYLQLGANRMQYLIQVMNHALKLEQLKSTKMNKNQVINLAQAR